MNCRCAAALLFPLASQSTCGKVAKIAVSDSRQHTLHRSATSAYASYTVLAQAFQRHPTQERQNASTSHKVDDLWVASGASLLIEPPFRGSGIGVQHRLLGGEHACLNAGFHLRLGLRFGPVWCYQHKVAVIPKTTQTTAAIVIA